MRKVLVILMALVTFLNATQLAQAASTVEKTSSIFSEPKQFDGKIRIDINGATVKYVRHAKYETRGWQTPTQVAQVKGTKITGFAYNCPGYYLTRVYSDSSGNQLLGYIRVHVKAEDVPGAKGCPPVDESEPKAPPPIINKTHPIPEIEEPKNMVKDGKDYDDGNSGGSSSGGGGTIPPEEEIDWTEWGKPANFAEACARKNTGGITDWTIKWADKSTDGAIVGPHCVLMSTCMYDDSQWYCNASDKPPTSGGTDPGGIGDGVPPREQYSVLVDEEDFGACGIGDTIENNAVSNQCVGGGATSPEEENGGKEDGGGEGCEICKVFECPGWEKYLSTLYDVAAFAVGDVEPPPVPDLPRPNVPNIFDVLNDVEQRNPAKPTGDDGLKDTPFDAEDVKNIGELPYRDDPTGGFNIIDPLSNLPEDGSTAPRPEGDPEKVPYPTDSKTDMPTTNDGATDTKVKFPSDPGGKVKYPDDPGGKVKYPIP